MIPPTFDPHWSDELQALHRHDMQVKWDRRIAPQIWNQYHDQLERYLPLAGDAPLRILDVGSAQGTLALLLAERGHNVTAVDIRPQFLGYGGSRWSHGEIEFLAANVLDDALSDTYDLVFAIQIIEHLGFAPTPVLKAADRALLAMPWLGRKSAHQLMVIGNMPGRPDAGLD